jgi:hypothetical protein
MDLRQSAVTVKGITFWGVKPRSVVEVYGRFGGNYCLHLQG